MDNSSWKAVGSPTRDKSRLSTTVETKYGDHPAFGLGLETKTPDPFTTSPVAPFTPNRHSAGSPVILPHPNNGNRTLKFIDPSEEEEQLPQSFSLWNQNGIESAPLQNSYQLPLKDESAYDLNNLVDSAKQRSRSKSSSAAYGLQFEPLPLLSPDTIWSQQPQEVNNLIHRRSSTTPSYNPLWGAPMPNGLPPGVSPGLSVSPGKMRNSVSAYEQMEDPMSMANHLPSPDVLERYRQQRRFSHAPQIFYNDYGTYLSPDMSLGPQQMVDNKRRHSLAGPLLPSPRFMTEGFEEMTLNELDESQEPPSLKDIDDYFENTEHRTRAYMEAGKNLQANHSLTPTWPLYVVEFKAGRRDYFYFVDDGKSKAKKGDLVIVEADRGKDLGKVIHDHIQNENELKDYQDTHPDVLQADQTNFSVKQIIPKRIYRNATSPEISLLVQKSQDELKALTLCIQKIRQHKLTMEVVDAEYQWDRRKLTFYFVSDRRIDFRELVRDLFKIYKTRIWMCAVNPNVLAEKPIKS